MQSRLFLIPLLVGFILTNNAAAVAQAQKVPVFNPPDSTILAAFNDGMQRRRQTPPAPPPAPPSREIEVGGIQLTIAFFSPSEYARERAYEVADPAVSTAVLNEELGRVTGEKTLVRFRIHTVSLPHDTAWAPVHFSLIAGDNKAIQPQAAPTIAPPDINPVGSGAAVGGTSATDGGNSANGSAAGQTDPWLLFPSDTLDANTTKIMLRVSSGTSRKDVTFSTSTGKKRNSTSAWLIGGAVLIGVVAVLRATWVIGYPY
jgi:hypothetical protein